MTKKESRPPKRAESGSSPPSFEDHAAAARTAFVSSFFKTGAEITEELVKENERLRAAARQLEAENTVLRTQLKSDDAIREALKKIDELEREKDSLLSQFSTRRGGHDALHRALFRDRGGAGEPRQRLRRQLSAPLHAPSSGGRATPSRAPGAARRGAGPCGLRGRREEQAARADLERRRSPSNGCRASP